MSGNMNGAIKEIEKLEKGLSNNSSVKDALKKQMKNYQKVKEHWLVTNQQINLRNMYLV